MRIYPLARTGQTAVYLDDSEQSINAMSFDAACKAAYIEIVHKDGSGTVIKDRNYSIGPIPVSTEPVRLHEVAQADRLLRNLFDAGRHCTCMSPMARGCRPCEALDKVDAYFEGAPQPVVNRELVAIEDVPEGGFFRKRNGKFTYIRISYASAGRFINQTHGRIFGVTYNGNMTSVEQGTQVQLCTIDDFAENVREDQQWHEDIGAGEA
jgi:hypothetical protein